MTDEQILEWLDEVHSKVVRYATRDRIHAGAAAQRFRALQDQVARQSRMLGEKYSDDAKTQMSEQPDESPDEDYPFASPV